MVYSPHQRRQVFTHQPVQYDRTTGRLPRLPLAYSFGIYSAQERVNGAYPQPRAQVPPTSPLFAPQSTVRDVCAIEPSGHLDVALNVEETSYFPPFPKEKPALEIIVPETDGLSLEVTGEASSSEDEHGDSFAGQRLKTSRGVHTSTGEVRRYFVDLTKGQLPNSRLFINFNKFKGHQDPLVQAVDIPAAPLSPNRSGLQAAKPFPSRTLSGTPVRQVDRSQLRRGVC